MRDVYRVLDHVFACGMAFGGAVCAAIRHLTGAKHVPLTDLPPVSPWPRCPACNEPATNSDGGRSLYAHKYDKCYRCGHNLD